MGITLNKLYVIFTVSLLQSVRREGGCEGKGGSKGEREVVNDRH